VAAPQAGLLDELDRTNQLRAAYGVYPPYTQEDPNTREVSGFSVDVINEIGKQLHVTVTWHRLNWNTMAADLKRGEFDIIADPIFETVPRARELTFSEPYAYFPDGIVVVRKNERRFSSFKSLDQRGITIVTGQGWASEALVHASFTRPHVVTVQVTTDVLQVFNEVVSGRADAAVADGDDAERFVREHPSEVKALFLDKPPALSPAAFALRPGDLRGAYFINVSLHSLSATGTLNALRRKYGLRVFRPTEPI
jgi:cyclohexadienyl dehydratase